MQSLFRHEQSSPRGFTELAHTGLGRKLYWTRFFFFFFFFGTFPFCSRAFLFPLGVDVVVYSGETKHIDGPGPSCSWGLLLGDKGIPLTPGVQKLMMRHQTGARRKVSFPSKRPV